MEIAVQVNGKLRAKLTVATGAAKEDAIAAAKAEPMLRKRWRAKPVLVCKAAGQHRRKHARGKITREKVERRFPHHAGGPGAGRHGEMYAENL